MSYGPAPWRQTQWDWRAAGNFVCGGAGGGLIALAAVSASPPSPLLLLAGMALVGSGLACVWLEIGRPLRALHVFFNPRRSWMTREAFVAALLMPAVLAAALGVPGTAWLAAALALAFVYCQARILHAAKGIPAWREPLIVPLVVATGLAEGAGLLLLLHAAQGASPPWLLALAGALALARLGLWRTYRPRLTAQAKAALDFIGRCLFVGDAAAALLLFALALADVPALPLVTGAGLWLAATGAVFKYRLITRAAFNQGFALAQLPVRGVRR